MPVRILSDCLALLKREKPDLAMIVERWDSLPLPIRTTLAALIKAAELQYRLSLRDTPRRQRIARLNWEINNRTTWNEDIARGSPHAAAIPLSDGEVEAKRRELQQLTRTSFARRVFTYFMGCFGCQALWTAVAIYALTRGVTDPAGWFFSAAAYSGAAVLLPVVYSSGPCQLPDVTRREQGCEGCTK